MLARQIMSAPVVSACPKTTLLRAIELMLETGVSGLPVIDAQGALVGILTEGDLLRRVELNSEVRRPRWIQYLRSPGTLAEEYAHSRGRMVEEVMSSPVTTVAEDASVREIIEVMTRNRIRRVPIVRASAVVGMVSRADIVRALGTALAAEVPHRSRSDAEIRRDILAEFDRAVCIPKAAIDVNVRGGAVELRGCITDERERGAVHAAVENVPGVTGLRDHLTWVEPLSGTVLLSPDDEKDRGAGVDAQPAAENGAPVEGGRP
ncbi:CBS domain-containing protein [Methylobacterium sp. NEAU K]|uniref:CBS domain-containing protein n=1 Tax=Methylobacterium sp. NEAU K TaxID=3064946 RepID=UPI002736E4C7|nr:CBS domain-containing protein [Methylobacterium sp. NEAU K]MDP4003313.1 CBS domain-containing protein [Methylobacterium sp. NEAU K]